MPISDCVGMMEALIITLSDPNPNPSPYSNLGLPEVSRGLNYNVFNKYHNRNRSSGPSPSRKSII